jgi:hypothetical protein
MVIAVATQDRVVAAIAVNRVVARADLVTVRVDICVILFSPQNPNFVVSDDPEVV